jgi:tRNA pseudouridine38-40 synthase
LNNEPLNTTEAEIAPIWPRYFLGISYDGTQYHGWQRQTNGQTIQSVIEDALRKLLRQESVVTIGCGRTDTGVHAQQFFLHFNAEKEITDIEGIYFRLNMMLPRDIGLQGLWRVHDRSHARFDAIERSYYYDIHTRRNPFLEKFSTFYPWQINLERMNDAAKHLISKRDYSSFCKSGGGQTTGICDIRKAFWEPLDDHRIRFHITADRFLRNMVRAITGTLIDIGGGKYGPQEIENIIEEGKRSAAGQSMPPQGLHLSEVLYSEPLQTILSEFKANVNRSLLRNTVEKDG